MPRSARPGVTFEGFIGLSIAFENAYAPTLLMPANEALLGEEYLMCESENAYAPMTLTLFRANESSFIPENA